MSDDYRPSFKLVSCNSTQSDNCQQVNASNSSSSIIVEEDAQRKKLPKSAPRRTRQQSTRLAPEQSHLSHLIRTARQVPIQVVAANRAVAADEDLRYEPSSYVNANYNQHTLSQYSSSQAQLQSLNNCQTINMSSSPKSCHKQTRTKPMTAMHEPVSTISRHQQVRVELNPPPYEPHLQHVICHQPSIHRQPFQFPLEAQHQSLPGVASLVAGGQQHQSHQPHQPATNNHQQLVGESSSGNCSPQQLTALGKSGSCLTCADISIKWYIVVIALLGLICALIGTIVGAVHSAGRDYISLALLLIGKYNACSCC